MNKDRTKAETMETYKELKERQRAERQQIQGLRASIGLNTKHGAEILDALFNGNGGQFNADFAEQMFYTEMDNTEYFVRESPAPVLAACHLTADDLEQTPELKAAFTRAAARYMAKRNG